MTRIVISYSRVDRPKTKQLVRLLRDVYGFENVWWDENFFGGQLWWDEILLQISECDVFVYLLSPTSLGSPYCQAELQEALRLRKPIIPVSFTRRTSIPDMLARLQYVDLTGRVNRKTITPLLRAINEAPSHNSRNEQPLSNEPVEMPDVHSKESRNILAEYTAQIIVAVVATIIGGILLAIVIQDARFSTRPIPPVIESEQAVVTAVPTMTPTDSPATTLTHTPYIDATSTAVQLAATETTAYSTLLALSATSMTSPTASRTFTPRPTRTPRPTNTPSPTSTEIATEDRLLFEDFEDIQANQFESVGLWRIVEEDNNHFYDIECRIAWSCNSTFGNLSWSNYGVRLRFRVLPSGEGFILRFRFDGTGNFDNYILQIYPDDNWVTLSTQENGGRWQTVVSNTHSFARNSWNWLQVEAIDERIQVLINDRLVIDTLDPKFDRGRLSLDIAANSHVQFDDILIWELDNNDD